MPREVDRRLRVLHRVLAGALVLVLVMAFVLLMRQPPNQPQGADSASPSSPATASAAPSVSAEPEVFGARHVLIQYAGSQRAPVDLKRTKEEAKTRAGQVAAKAAKILAAHRDLEARAEAFAALVKEYSDEPGAGERGGELGRFRPDAIDPSFSAAVAKLKKGEVSGAVETPFGFHVILRTH